MKKIFITVSLLSAALFNSSCKKDEPETVTVTETVTETVTVTDTVTINSVELQSIVLTVKPFEQSYFGSTSGYSSVTVDYSANNLGDKEISILLVKFEAITKDGSIYNGSDYIFDLGKGDNISSQSYISVASKECTSVRIKEVEITTK